MDRNMIYAGSAIVMAGLLGFSWGKGGGGLNADDSKPAAHEIAVVDMNKVFAAHKGLIARNEDLKREVERAQESGKALLEAGQKLKNDLNGLKKGSAEFQRVERELQQKADEWKKLSDEATRKATETQAANFLWTYQLVAEQIQQIADARGYRLVINFSSEAIDQKDLRKWQMIANRQVLYQNSLDITDDVINAVN
ncbi:MAG TPA: OmpH family outer membrane protein [Planctomycetaceae bacterium]|jgi:Skp family chaperone for outer membrane proteins